MHNNNNNWNFCIHKIILMHTVNSLILLLTKNSRKSLKLLNFFTQQKNREFLFTINIERHFCNAA